MTAKIFFYGSILVIWIALLIVIRKRPFKVRHLFVWISYSLYSLVYEIFFGEVLKLYYYITPDKSILYILLGSLFLYPVIMVIYVLFLPAKKVFWYTVGWIVFTQILEVVSLYTKTVVLTGWKVIPWSPITYIITYTLFLKADEYFRRIIQDKPFRKKTYSYSLPRIFRIISDPSGMKFSGVLYKMVRTPGRPR